MQSLTAPPRDSLTTAQVLTILTADRVTVTAGLELLSSALVVTEDISDGLIGGTVAHGLLEDIHGSCSLELDRELAWGVQLVRPYQTLTAGGVSARFNLGVYGLTTPDQVLGQDTFAVQGYDRLFLLNRPVGDTYSVAAGTSYLTAIAAAFTAAGLTGVSIDPAASAKVLPVDKVWPLLDSEPATWLTVLNDLLTAINYRAVWADQDGIFQCAPYVLPADRVAEFTFDTTAATIVGQERTVKQDVWQVPNRWVFIQSNRDPILSSPIEGDGLFTYVLPDAHAMSAVSRGLVWSKVVNVEAADQPVLEALAASLIAADLRVTTTFDVTTGPFPVAGHADIFTYDDPDYGPAAKVQATHVEIPLDGSDLRWTWERA